MVLGLRAFVFLGVLPKLTSDTDYSKFRVGMQWVPERFTSGFTVERRFPASAEERGPLNVSSGSEFILLKPCCPVWYNSAG